MPHFDIIKRTTVTDTYRVQAVIGAFDLDVNHIDEHFEGNIDIEGKECIRPNEAREREENEKAVNYTEK